MEDISYRSIDELCKNVKIVCDLEIIDALSEIDFPANKNDIMDYVRFRNFSEFVVRSLKDLPDDYTFKSISDICKELL